MSSAAEKAYVTAMTTMTAAQRSQDIGLGGDGTPTMFLDAYVEHPVLQILKREKINVLSEEAGWIDRGSAITAVIDPVDGTANSAAGVPISAFSAAIVVDDVIHEARITWLGTNYVRHAHRDDPVFVTVSERTTIEGSSISMLRPRQMTWPAWSVIAQRAERLRILGATVLEAALVTDGAVDAFCDPGGDIHRIVDLAAVSLIVEKSGGHIRDLHDRPFTFDPDLTRRWSGIVAGTRELADELATTILSA